MFVGQLLAFATTSPVNGVLLWSVSFRPSPAILPLASRLSPLQPTPPPSLSLPPACSSAPLPPRRPLARALPGWRIVNAGKLADMAACRQSLSSTPALLHASHTTHHAPLATHRESVCKERERAHTYTATHTRTRATLAHTTHDLAGVWHRQHAPFPWPCPCSPCTCWGTCPRLSSSVPCSRSLCVDCRVYVLRFRFSVFVLGSACEALVGGGTLHCWLFSRCSLSSRSSLSSCSRSAIHPHQRTCARTTRKRTHARTHQRCI